MTYDSNNWPRWATIEVQYDIDASLDDYDDGCLPHEFREKYKRGQVWFVGIVVRDKDTDDTESLWSVATEDMCETKSASFDDLDEHGQEVALDLLHWLAHTRLERLTREAARFANLAAAEARS